MDDIITQITEKPIISSKATQRISIFPTTKDISLNSTIQDITTIITI